MINLGMHHYKDYQPYKDMRLNKIKYIDLSYTNSFRKFKYLSKDENGREIYFYEIIGARLTGRSLYYPNCLIYSNQDRELYDPIEEKIMSLQKVNEDRFDMTQDDLKPITMYYDQSPVFYFIYNTDNYYHFVYDSLPYLITFLHLKSNTPELKLLMNYPNSQKKEFYKFVTEFLEILGIGEKDILIANEETVYKWLYVSSSYTHGNDSNLPPRKEIYDFYQNIVQRVKSKNQNRKTIFPEKIYISRRTHLNSDRSNIGTDYTSKRKLNNEDELADYLTQQGFTEVFTENYSTEDKILMFANAEHVVGSIGGGLCNVLFSNPECKLTAIISPTFLDVNYRFKYSLENIDVSYFHDTVHDPDQEWKKYMRVRIKTNNIIGEIIDISENILTISYIDELVAGWNNSLTYKIIVCNKSDCEKLDNGLNSPFKVNMESLKQLI
jgi:capsular polysaccharide biosynthesis protein